MAGKTKVTPAKRKAVLAAAASGLSQRDIATREGLGLGTVNAVLTASREARNAAGRRAVPTPPPSEPAADHGAADLEAEALDALAAADRAYERLDTLHGKLCKRLDDELQVVEPNFRSVAPLAKLSLEVAVTLAKTRPPVQVRPEDDPANLEAAETLLVRLAPLIASAEGRR